MSHIVSFTIHGLAGRTEPLSICLNRDTNILFGLNGSGKTSLLKILHAAMANDVGILESVPFVSAEVSIYSRDRKKVFTRSIEKRKKSKGNSNRNQSMMRGEFAMQNEMIMLEEPTSEESMQWTCTPSSPKEVTITRWAHKYLPTSRLHVSDAPFFSRPDRSVNLTEAQLDIVFAKSVEHLWSRYSSGVLKAVRTAQEHGLASILRAVLSPQSASNRRKSKLTSSTAFDRVHSFLERQGSVSILGEKSDFEKRYVSNNTLQDVVQDIDAVEDKIKEAMASRDSLQELITNLFMANKRISFTDESIKVTSNSGETIGLTSLSSGEKHLLRILVEALLVGDSSLIIDEPEISMHVDWQKGLIKSLRTLNTEAQLILATHSPEVMADVSDDKIFRI